MTEKMKDQIIQGDCLEVLKTLPDESVDCIITSPPYWGLRNYGAEGQIGLEPTFKEYLDKILLITAELKRILKAGGSFWLNMGDSYGGIAHNDWTSSNPEVQKIYTKNRRMKAGGMPKLVKGGEKCLTGQPWRMALAMIDQQGWILRSDIKWIKQILLWKEKRTIGSVMPTSVKDRFNNSGEYLFHFVKNKKYYFNLDAVRIKPQTFENRPAGIDREKDYPEAKRNKNAFNYRVRDAVRKQGQPQFVASENEIKNYKQVPETYGKKKLKGIEDEKLGNRWMSGTPNFTRGDDRAIGAKEAGMHTFYTHSKRFKPGEYKAKYEIDPNFAGVVNAGWDKTGALYNPNGKNLPNAWLIGTEPQKDAHFAMFPTALCEIPILTSCPPDGIVFDPFMGGGSTAVCAKRLNRNFLGIEINPDYIKIADKRIANVQPTLL